MKQQANNAALLCRLSRDDGGDYESNSIGNQRDILRRYAVEHGFTIYDEYIDDGISGLTFDRPGFKRMLADIEAGKIDVVLCKDLSRLGRVNAMVAYYTEIYFPDNGVRFVAINDSIDTFRGENELMGFKSIINEMYARDISKKIRSTMHNMALKGQYKAPYALYGYSKDPNDRHRLIVNEETAPVVQRIFRLAAAGITVHSIRVQLSKDKILTPRAYIAHTTGKYSSPTTQKYPTDWCPTSVIAILKNREYLGHTISQKQTTKSFKSKTYVNRPKEEGIEVRNTHPALVDEQTFDTVQGYIKTKRGACAIREGNIWAGLLKCSDCGNNLIYCTPVKNNAPFFTCSKYKRHSKRCTSHYITIPTIEKLVLGDIREKAATAKRYEGDFMEYARMVAVRKGEHDVRQGQADLEKHKQRCAEIDTVLKRMVEQNALGVLADERFTVLMREYEAEQADLMRKIKEAEQKMSKQKADCENAVKFYDLIHKYTDIEELTAPILHEVIDRIKVYNAVGVGKRRVQDVEIFYRFVGLLPDELTPQ